MSDAAPMVRAAPAAAGVRRAGAACLRRGFTLVELLAVVSIIALIMALATPVIFKARASAINAKVKAEVDMLHTALMNYKNEYGSFPPANFGPAPNVGPLWDGGSVNTRHPVYRHLVRIFPRLDEQRSGPGSPYAQLANLTPAQALVFWLQGFYPNPAFPLTNGTNGQGIRKKLYDFDATRLIPAAVPAQQVQDFLPTDTGDVFARKYPVYFVGDNKSGTPYVYFDSRCYDLAGADVTYTCRNKNGFQTTARPYFTSLPPLNPLWSQLHMMPDSFQIVAAGSDGMFGANVVAFPGGLSNPGNFQLTYPGVTDPSSTDHRDNLTNFADGPLADAADRSKSN